MTTLRNPMNEYARDMLVEQLDECLQIEAPAAEAIISACLDLASMLVEKNYTYGNSALQPVSYLSTASAEERLRIRIDDKINRLANGDEYGDENTIEDLAGYLILLTILRGQ